MTDMTQTGGQAQRMQAALSPVLSIGPDFLAGRRSADDMAHTMVRAVQDYANAEQARSLDGARPDDAEASASGGRTVDELHAVLTEVYTCGSGYLADRCDSDCVARTMAQIMGELGD
jgi:hypothetical protein